MTIEDRITATLKAAGQIIQVDEGRLEVVRPSLQRSVKRSRWIGFYGAFVAVTLVALVVSLVRPAEPGPSAASASILTLTDSGPLVWRTVLELPSDTSVEFLVHGPEGWVALTRNNRQSNDYSNALTLGSNDGVEWFELRPGGFTDAVHVQGIVAYPDGYVAYGLYASPNYTVTTLDRPSNFAEPAVWTSQDRIEWTLVPLPLPPSEEAISEVVSYLVGNLVSVGRNVIAIGTEFDEVVPEGVQDGVGYAVPTRPILWMADESGSWRLIGESPLTDVEAFASGPAGVVALSPVGSGDAIWSTADGLHWSQIASLAGGAWSLHGNESGYLLSTDVEAVLFSIDGVAWSPIEGVDGLIGGGPGGFASFGSTVKWSPDGQRWREIGPSDLLAELEWTPVVGVDTGAVIVPGRNNAGAGRIVVGTNR